MSAYAEKKDSLEIESLPPIIKNNFSLDKPIKIGKTEDPKEVQRRIEEFVELNYPDYEIQEVSTYGYHKNYFIKHATLIDKQGNFLKDEKGHVLFIPFDVSEFRKLFKKKHAAIYQEMEKAVRKLQNSKRDHFSSDGPIGMDYRNPFVLKGKTQEEIEKEEQDIIAKAYPNSTESIRMLWLFNRRYIERISLNVGKNDFGEDQFVILNFDVTAHMVEYLKSHQVKKTKMSELVTQIEKLPQPVHTED